MVENCINISDEWIIDIFIHLVILVIVLSAAFWIFIAPLEKREFSGQIQNQISSSMKDAFQNIPKSPAPSPISKINLDVLISYYGRPDKTTDIYNSWLKKVNIIMIVVLLLAFILTWALLSISCKKCVPVGRIFMENIALFACIGAVEVLFFIKVASKFIPVKPSFMVQQFFEDMKTKFNP